MRDDLANLTTSTAVAESLKYVAHAGWGERSVQTAGVDTTFVPIEAADLKHAPGTLWSEIFDYDLITRAMTVPTPGFYIVVTVDEVPTAYKFTTRTEALTAYALVVHIANEGDA